MVQLWLQFTFQEDGRDPHPDLCEWLVVAFDRHADLVNRRRSVNHFQLLAQRAIHNRSEILALLHYLSEKLRIRMHHGAAVEPHQGHVVDGGGISDDRLQQGIQPRIGLQAVNDRRVQGRRVAGVDFRAGQIDLERLARGIEYLVCDKMGAIVSIGQAVLDQLGEVEKSEGRYQRYHHRSDSEDELRLEADPPGHIRARSAAAVGGSSD